MRLGQLARKFDIPVQEIIDYLEEETGEKFHANAKIYDTLESKVFSHFELIPTSDEDAVESGEAVQKQETESLTSKEEPEDATEEVEEAPEKWPSTPEEEIAALEGDLASAPVEEQVQPTVELEVEVKTKEELTQSQPSDDEIIQTDKLLEMLESDEAPADLDKIKLIKAPKKELSGLKVVGKVDLPEPRKKEEKPKEIVTEKDLREYRNPKRKKRAPLSEEEKEKRRLKAKKKKEDYEARQEKRRKEQEERKNKARKEAHYKQKLEQIKTTQAKQKAKQEPPTKQTEDSRPVPKTMLGKFWRWMNT